MTPLVLDIHAIQSVPYSNLNRDQLGLPKTTEFGGKTRTRVSSQCWKRATRLATELAIDDPTFRSRRAAHDIHDELVTVHGWDSDLALFAGRQAMQAAGFGLNAPKKAKDGTEEEEPHTTKVLLWYTHSAIVDIAKLCVSHRHVLAEGHQAAVAKKARKKPVANSATADNGDAATSEETAAESKVVVVLDSKQVDQIQQALIRRSASINLFGRFLAELPEGTIDGAVSVAHAFTTHASAEEVDYFTAVDDRRSRGGGHLDTAEFSSGTYYRYSTVKIDDLAANLDGTLKEAIELAAVYAKHFVTSVPSGKQHSTAAFTVPDLVYMAVRTDRPISLANAFEGSVRAGAGVGGYTAASCAALATYAGNSHRFLGTDNLPFHRHVALTPDPMLAQSLGEPVDSLAELIDAAVQAMHTAAEPVPVGVA